MDRKLEEFRAQLEGLARELRHVQKRLDRLEARNSKDSLRLPSHPAGAPQADDIGQLAVHPPMIPPGTLTLVGRTLIVIGGASLLRAITGTAIVPAAVGPLAGLGYAAWWLFQADRSAAQQRRLSAIFHGLAAVMIAYPLIWETTSRFGLLTSGSAATVLVLFLGLGLVVASRHELGEVAWTVTIASVLTTVILLVGTHDLALFTIALLLIATTVEALAFRERWLGLRWPVAVPLDLAVLVLVTAAIHPENPPAGQSPIPSELAIAVTLALPGVYFLGIGARTLLRERPVTVFEVVQAAIALLLGFGGALRVITLSGAQRTPVGVASLLLGAMCYAAAFAFIDRRSGRGRNFYTYTTFAGLLVLIGSYSILTGASLALAWSGLAIVAVTLGGRFNRITLKFHGSAYLTAAAIVAGLLAFAFDGLFADPGTTWQRLTTAGIAVAGTAACCYGILVASTARTDSPELDRLPQMIIAAVLVLSAAGVAAQWLTDPLIASFDAAASRGFVAASRTGVLAVLAVAIAWAGRRWSLRELTWLVYPVLAAGGGKLVFEDFRYGQPLTLFLALAFYGGALVVTPRLLRS